MKPTPDYPRTIQSRNHPKIKRIRSLHLRGERERTGLYYIEGMRFIAQAVLHHAPIEALVVCRPLLESPFAKRLVLKQEQVGIPILDVTPEVMHGIAQVDDPQGIGAVVRQKWLPLERVKMSGKLCWIACDTVQSAGNLGTILRTSDAVGGAGVIFLGDATDPYDPATVRASMGAMFSQRFVRTTIDEFARWKAERRWLLVGTSPSAGRDYSSVSYDSPVVLLMGSERKGLSEELQSICDLLVHIPMVGHTDSLNVGVATGVMLYELFNQRRMGRMGRD
jgi:RNA methyltransferase, TrmH family